ncbi:MAG: hypothetical protein LBT26_04570 [Clostridiales Family XIII bacterium]|jgi:uncharacterized C2H2 Zn-finger protein|nr:hypothetical protein [Clostridiales Family XIII bacterium]
MSGNYTYELASEKDGAEIAALLESTEFKGGIALACARRPNAVASLRRDGENAAFCVVRDARGGLVGTGGCTVNKMRVFGELVNVAYLTGMRGTGRANIAKCYALLRDFCRENDVRHTYTTILRENTAVQRMLEKPRKSMPAYRKHAAYTVNIVRKGLRIRDGHVLQKAAPADLADLLAERARLDFAPCVPDYDGFYVLKDGQGTALACGKVWRQQDYKQYIVKKYGWKFRLLKPFLPWLPAENDVLKLFALSFVAAKDDAALESLLRHVSNIGGGEDFFLYGADVCPVPHFSCGSFIYLVDWDKQGLEERLRNATLSIEPGML